MFFKYKSNKMLFKLKGFNIFAVLLFCILLLSFLIRFIGLGYSDFYGDETKTFYLNKTIPAFEFFMDQRKGPIQFIVVWIVEKIINGHDEFYTRIPFSIAGFLSVIVFYLLSKDLVNKLYSSFKISSNVLKYFPLISTILYSFNGFNIAFSRVIQYQSFLLLFGLLGIYLFLHKKYLTSAINLGFALLAHYDALFFFLPVFYLFFMEYKSISINKNATKNYIYKLLLSFVLPLFIITSSFYVPYVYKGYFGDNALNYLNRRLSGDTSMKPNDTIFTINFYNPYYAYLILLSLPLFGFVIVSLLNIYNIYNKVSKKKFLTSILNSFLNSNLTNNLITLLLFWFLPTFIFYEFVVSNPGTHIHNYFIPLYMLSAYMIIYFYNYFSSFSKSVYVNLYNFILLVLGFISIFTSFRIFVPYLSYGYPWNVSSYSDIHNRNQIFIYGFPYNRSWNQVSEYFNELDSRVTGIFTNDDDTVAEYYLQGFIYTRPGSNFFPQYYIDVKDNQSFLEYKSFVPLTKEEFIRNYEEVMHFDNSVIYKYINRKTPLVGSTNQ